MRLRSVSAAIAVSMVVAALPAILTAAAGPAVAAASVASPRDGDLLIANHSFESGVDSWRIQVPGAVCPPGAVATTDEQAADGRSSLRIRTGGDCRVAGAVSQRVPAVAGEQYRGFVRLSAAGGAATARLVFFDAAGAELAAGPKQASTGRAWTTVRLTGTAPQGAATMAVAVDADPALPGTSYVDDVRVSAQWTDVGDQIHSVSVNGVAYGVDAAGRDTAYQVVTGSAAHPAHLVGVLMATGEVVSDVALPGAQGAWNATTAPDGTVYVGSYTNGHLYQYRPGAATAVDLGRAIAGDSFVWDVAAAPDGSVYGGGFPSGGIFRWTPGSGFSQIGPRQIIAPEQYVRGIAYDPDLDLVYGGVGSHAHLMACAGSGTAPCTDILPAELRDLAFAYNISAGDGYVMVRMENGGRTVVLQVTKGTDGAVSARQVADLGAVDYPGGSTLADGKFFYSKAGMLYAFDVTTATETALQARAGIYARRWTVLAMADQANWPGLTLVGANDAGLIVRYGIDSGKLETVASRDLPGSPTDINQVFAGPDQRIYSIGYFVGGMGAYTPLRGETTEYRPVGQAEGATVVGDAIYLGVYPKARIHVYRPSEPFVPNTNPREVCYLASAEQDRPYGMATAPDGRVYIGTMAAYGKLPGALSVYDPVSGQCQVIGNVVPDQTIHTLAWHDGKVYGGSLIWGGLGQEPSQTEAKFFRYDPATGQTKQYDLPVRGLRGVFGVTPGPDGKLWMTAESYLLAFDPATETWSHVSRPWAHLNYDLGPTDRLGAFDAFLRVGRDGAVYGVVHGAEFFRIDPSTMDVTTLRTGGANHLGVDEYGNLYFATRGTRLVRYAP